MPVDVEGFIVPRADEHLGEYVPPAAERLAWLTGFTGSAGLAIVLMDRGRRVHRRPLRAAVGGADRPAAFERLHITDQPPLEWAAARARRLGYDPWLLSAEAVARYAAAGIEMVPLSPNPVDVVWHDRPSPPSPAGPHPCAAGQASAAKREAIAAALRADCGRMPAC